MTRKAHMLLTAALAGVLCATSVPMLDTADADTRIIIKVKRPNGKVLEVFRGRPGTGVRAEANKFQNETEGNLVIIEIVKRDGEIVFREKIERRQFDEQRRTQINKQHTTSQISGRGERERDTDRSRDTAGSALSVSDKGKLR